MDQLTRRQTLRGAAVTGMAVPVLAACGSDEEDPPPPRAPEQTAGPGDQDGGTDPGSGEAFASTSDVAVGSCVVYPDEGVVVTQPSEGEFRCFSAICTHQGCLVSSSSDGDIPCRCHFSRFSLEDGSVLDGPAESPLPEVSIVVEGDGISRA